MLALRDLQRAFYAAVIGDDAGDMASRVRADGIDARDRVQIYRNNARAGFLASVTAAYPVIERLGGAEWFRQTVLNFQRECPSRSGDLQYAGECFADHLEKQLRGTAHEYFADVARLEWAYQEVLVAADEPVFDAATLGGIDANDYDRLVFEPRAAVRLIESDYPVLAIWKANQTGTGAGADSPDVPVSLADGPARVLVVRRAECVELRELSPASTALLRQFMRRESLGAAAAQVNLHHSDIEFAESFRELLLLQTIATFRIIDFE